MTAGLEGMRTSWLGVGDAMATARWRQPRRGATIAARPQQPWHNSAAP